MSLLHEAHIFRLKPLISNFNCKLSTITEYDPGKQLLCLVSEDNEILLRYTNQAGACALKLVSWFNKTSRVIHDVCFDPSGSWLLVLCFDNTLHIVPALKILDDVQTVFNNTFSTTEVTSFVIPFVGPHECPSSKTCPNNDTSTSPTSSPVRLADYIFESSHSKDNNNEHPEMHQIVSSLISENVDVQNTPYAGLDSTRGVSSSTETSSRKSSKNDASTLSRTNETNKTSRENSESFLISTTCPYPTSAAWWQTLDKRNRAVIGYSDGSICFVGLSPNCPFIANTSIENGGVFKLFVCRDNSMENVTLLINSAIKQQWKLLLEQKCINYTFPGDISPNSTQTNEENRDSWQFVLPVKSSDMSTSADERTQSETMKTDEAGNIPVESVPSSNVIDQKPLDTEEATANKIGLLPAARARLALLKNLGSKKINALRMRLADQKFKQNEYINEGNFGTFAIVDSPTTAPEILTTPAGPYFVVQNLRNTYLLSALHTYSDTLSVHSMDISLIPLFLYKIPKRCQEILIGSNLLYTIQLAPEAQLSLNPEEDTTSDEDESDEISEKKTENEEKLINAVSVISSAMASMKNGEEKKFNENALLGTFLFSDETIINIFRMMTYTPTEKPIPKEESNDTLQSGEISSASTYIRLQKKSTHEKYTLSDIQFMQNEFPKINYDPCIVVTNKNTYFIDLHTCPSEIFLDAALMGFWNICEEFCTTFDLNFQQCIEFAGDYLLRKKKVTQALLTYNVARIPPVRTALKLAIFGENYALMHLCAMALKCVSILKSKYFVKPIINVLFENVELRHTENLSYLKPKKPSSDEIVNEGLPCSDFNYSIDETPSSLQMSASSQFHLSNLLLITLAERAVKEKNYIPLWNFLVTNTKFHTNMTSIVLCQSGLYTAALLLALTRGACIDVFVGLVSVATQEFGWYSEINVLFYTLSETVFAECLTYLRNISVDYLNIIQNKLDKLEGNILERLEEKLNPYSPVFRPILFNLSLTTSDSNSEDNFFEINNFCKIFVETYLGIILQMEALKKKPDNLLNALSTFKLYHEDNQFAIESSNFSPISVGCSHCSCVIDGCAYFWGSNGVPSVYSVTKTSDPPELPHVVRSLEILSQLNLEVHATKCGRQHSLVLTNNGLYAFGSNQLGQLGIKTQMLCSLQPMLVEALDNKRITILEAGQYHNAAVADGHLYTWGWGVHGQLGHGNTENCLQPKVVSFFDEKKVIQVSLGHAHSLVLCSLPNGFTELFVFGSNHFGQLGIKQGLHFKINNTPPVKSLVPLKLEVSTSPLRLIHTKFFSNLAVDKNNLLYTWGSSPQALRLANQIKRRATAKQKIEDNIKKEIQKRMETGIKDDIHKFRNSFKRNKLRADNTKKLTDNNDNDDNENENEMPVKISDDSSLPKVKIEDIEVETSFINIQNIENDVLNIPEISITDLTEESSVETTDTEVKNENITEIPTAAEKNIQRTQNSIDAESMDHMFPQLVDSSEVSGQIMQMSSGLFHFALISSTSLLYTWGKNLEHQLGTEDKDRKTVNKPSPLENIENPLHVECGADFTVVITTDYVVKAFGGNANGQCGRDLSTSVDKTKSGKLFALPTTKRLMRLEAHCVESPTVINLPRPRIQMDSEPTRYLKSVPKFKPHLVQRTGLSLDMDTFRSFSSGGNAHDCKSESDDISSSVENVSLIEDDSITSAVEHVKNNNLSPNETKTEIHSDLLKSDDFRHYVHYCLYIFHGLYDSDKISEIVTNSSEFRIRILMLNFKFVEAFTVCLTECQTAQRSIKIFEFFTKDTSIVPMRKQDLKFFIYELFIHFLSRKFDLVECEKFFLADLDYYLLELSYVLFFNNNNTEIEQQLNRKFKNFFLQDMHENLDYKLEDTDRIFDSLSVKFKSIVCQRLLQVAEN